MSTVQYPRPGQPPVEAPSGHEIPHVPSPYAGRLMSHWELVKISIFWFGSNLIWGAFLGPVLAQEMTVLAPRNSAQMLGLLYFVAAFPALLIPLIVGALSDRCTHPRGRRKPFILWGGLGGTVGLAVMLLAAKLGSLPVFFLGYLVVQTGMNTAIAAFSGIIPDLVPQEQKGAASGWMAVMSNVATLIGGVVSGVLVADNPQLVFLLLAVVFTFFLVLSVLGIRENRLEGEVPKMQWGPYLRSLWSVLADHPDFRWVWITRALMMLGFYAVSPMILFFLRDQLKLENPAKDAGMVMGIILIGATISGLIGGAISDRTGRKPVVYFATALISIMSLSFIFCHTLIQTLLAGVVFGIGYGAYISVDWALGADVLPAKEDAAKDMGVWHIAMVLPQQISPLIGGAILGMYEIAGTKDPVRYQPGGFAGIFIFAAVFFALSGLLLRNVKGAR